MMTDQFLKNTKLTLFLIVMFGLSLRLLFFTGMGISDPLVYSKAANDINLGKGIDPLSTITLSTRLGIIYATAFSYKIFGINDFSSVFFVLLTSVAGIILIYYFGKLLFNEKTGLTAAFLLSFFPLDVVYSTQLISDISSAFFMSLGVYAFLYGEIKNKTSYWSYLLSGLFIGIGYLIRESVLLIALFFIAYIIYKKKIKPQYFMVPLGILIVASLEMMIFTNMTGNPFFRFTESQKYLYESYVIHNYFGRLDFPRGLFHYPWMFLTNNLVSVFYTLTFASAAYFIFSKKKETYSLLIWLLPVLLYLSFGSSSLTNYTPFLAMGRYTTITTIPAMLLSAYFLRQSGFVKSRSLISYALVTLLVASTAIVYFHGARDQLASLRELNAAIPKLQKTVYLDERSIKSLDYLSKYEGNQKLNVYPRDMSKISNAYVVINREMIRNVREANPTMVFPAEIENPPSGWQLIMELGAKEKISVYEAK